MLYITYVNHADMKLNGHRNNYICQIYSITNYQNFTESNIWGRVATPVKQGQAHISLSKPLSYAYLP